MQAIQYKSLDVGQEVSEVKHIIENRFLVGINGHGLEKQGIWPSESLSARSTKIFLDISNREVFRVYNLISCFLLIQVQNGFVGS